MGKNKNKKKNQSSDAAAETPVETPTESTKETEEDTKMEGATNEAVPNDGVKLLEEVFGSKASVTSDDSASNNSSTDTKDTKDEAKTEVIGPLPPAEDDFEEEQIAKAEEHKTQGNNFFKGKQTHSFFARNHSDFFEI